VENGRFYGMGYIDSEVIISDLSQIKDIMPYKTNQYIMQLIFSFAQVPRKVHLYKNNSDLHSTGFDPH
jgi:DNA polymerase-3 subunit epsilon